MVESINHLDKLEMLKFRQKPAINPKDKQTKTEEAKVGVVEEKPESQFQKQINKRYEVL